MLLLTVCYLVLINITDRLQYDISPSGFSRRVSGTQLPRSLTECTVDPRAL